MWVPGDWGPIGNGTVLEAQVSERELFLTILREREAQFLIGNPLVRIHLIIEMIWWTGLAP